MTLLERGKAIWNLFTSGGMTKADKWILVLALAYCLSPIDIIPDVIPVIGIFDDILVVLIALRRFAAGTLTREPVPVTVKAKVVE